MKTSSKSSSIQKCILRHKQPRHTLPALLTLLGLLLSSSFSAAQSGDAWQPRYLHAMLGFLSLDDAWTISDENDVSTTADRDDLIYGGAIAQLSASSGKLQYGLESGGLISFQNDTSYFVQQNGGLTAEIKLKNNLWLLDLSLGGFVSYRLINGLRLYAATGPAIVMGSLKIEDEPEVTPQSQSSTIIINTSGRENDIDIGLYGRVGLEFITRDNFSFGLSARWVDSTLDFSNNGEIALDDAQYFITLGNAF